MLFQESYHGEWLSGCLAKVVNGYCNTVGPTKECVGILRQIARGQSVNSTGTIQCFFSQPVLSESGGNLQDVLEPHVSCNFECVAETVR